MGSETTQAFAAEELAVADATDEVMARGLAVADGTDEVIACGPSASGLAQLIGETSIEQINTRDRHAMGRCYHRGWCSIHGSVPSRATRGAT